MPVRNKIPEGLKREVRQRANYLCEYCHASEKWQYVAFTIEHVIPLSKGGLNNLENLALSCFSCNRRKSNKLEGIDPQTGKIVELFNPRKHKWSEHFIWSSTGLLIIGLTDIGRATINIIDLNRERLLIIRAVDMELYRHPPGADLRLKE